MVTLAIDDDDGDDGDDDQDDDQDDDGNDGECVALHGWVRSCCCSLMP